jgi:hypothetical protein
MFEIRQLTGQPYVDRYAKRHGVVGGAEEARLVADTAAEPVAVLADRPNPAA